MTLHAGVRPALAAVLLLGSTACGGTLATVSVARVESPVWGPDARPAAVQVAPSVAWRTRPASLDAGVRYAPTVRMESGIAPMARHRLAADVGSGRTAGMHPYATLGLDYGTVRPGDLVAEGITDPLPRTDLLKSYAFQAEGGLRGRLGRRSEVRAGLAADRSGGVGTSADALPALSRARVFLRADHQKSRALRVDGGVQLTRYALDGASLLAESDARATLRLSRRLSVAASAGGAAARSPEGTASFRPIAGVLAAWDAPSTRGIGGRVSLATRPDFDRLDGGLRQRMLAQAGFDAAPHRGIRLGSAVN